MGSVSSPLQGDRKAAGRRSLFLLCYLLSLAVLVRWSLGLAALLPSLPVCPPHARITLHALARSRSGRGEQDGVEYDDLEDDISFESIGYGEAYSQGDDKQADKYIRRQTRLARTGRADKAISDEGEYEDDDRYDNLKPSPLLSGKYRMRGYFDRRDIGRLRVRDLDSRRVLKDLSVEKLEQRLERRFRTGVRHRRAYAPVQQQAPAADKPLRLPEEKSRRPLRQAVRQRYSHDTSDYEAKQMKKELREHQEHFANKAQREFREDWATWGRFPPTSSGGDMSKIGGSRPLDSESEAGDLEALRAKLPDPLASRQSDVQNDDVQNETKDGASPGIAKGSKMHKQKNIESWLMPAQAVPRSAVSTEKPKPKEKEKDDRIGNSAFRSVYKNFIRRPYHPLPWERVEFDNVWMKASNRSWEEIGLDGHNGNLLVQQLKKFGVETPNILQEKALPEIMTGKDVLISTNTGSGKTLAFVLPLLQKHVLPRGDFEYKRSRLPNHLAPMILCRPQVLFVVPSRELAQQIFMICQDLLEPFPGLNATLLVGQYNHRRQDERLKKLRPAVVVGTPGKLMDHAMEGRLVLSQLNAVVLDEVDGLLSVSRQDHIKLLLQHIGGSEQTQRILASASGGSEDSKDFVGHIFNREYSVVGPQAGMILPYRVLHLVNGAPDVDKKIKFMMRLKSSQPEANCIMVFCNNHERARKVAEALRHNGMETDLLTGNRSKEARELAIRRFNKGEIQTLVATDAAMRGLDFRDLTHVVNFELPSSAVVYAHRAGRCGRMGYNGLVINLASGGAENKRLRSYADELGFELFEGNVRDGRLGVDEGRLYRPASHPDGWYDPYLD